VAILSQTAARRYWPDGNALGQRFKFNNDNAPLMEIVGIVADVHNHALDREATADLYLPYRQNPYFYAPNAMSLVLRTSGDQAALGPAIRSMVSSLDQSLPVSRIRPMEAYVGDSSAPRRFNLVLLGTFAVIALVLAAAGLYGVMSYLVSQRTGEIGIRMALGARPADVLRLIVSKAMTLTGVGVALGMVAALGATRLMSSLLYGVQARDPLVFRCGASRPDRGCRASQLYPGAAGGQSGSAGGAAYGVIQDRLRVNFNPVQSESTAQIL